MAGRVAAIFSAGGISQYAMVADSLGQGRRLHSAARDQIEVKRSLSVAQNARTQTEPMLFQSKPGNKRRPARSSLQRDLLPTRGENDHVDQDHDGFGGRCHRMRVPRARCKAMAIATPSTPTRPLSSAYRNLMNFRARQGSTAERGAVTGGVEMYRQVCTRIRVGVWGPSRPLLLSRSCQQQHPARQLFWSAMPRDMG